MDTVNLMEFLNRIKGAKYKELIQHHIKSSDTIRLLQASTGTISLLPQELQNLPIWERFFDHMNKYIPLKINDITLWDMDCLDAFIFIIKEANTYLNIINCISSTKLHIVFKMQDEFISLGYGRHFEELPSDDQELLFNIFQIITVGFAYNASNNRKIRRYMGIKKGFFT